MSASPHASGRSRACPVCAGAAVLVGEMPSTFSSRRFALARCSACAYAFVEEPRTDFTALYDAAYYSGRGADPLVDYEREMDDPRTVRTYEWQGLIEIVSSLTDVSPTTRWLDYGGGLGGLVRHVRRIVGCDAVGFEEGYGADRMRDRGIPHVTRGELDGVDGGFDVVTAIEVLEHAVDPVDLLRDVRRLLAPGGVFFLTTGNAAPHRDDLTRWSYARVPDVHIGFFEPVTLATALEAAGFDVIWPGFAPGLQDVIRYKVLKTAHIHHRNRAERLVPWRPFAKMVDTRYQVSAMPAGLRPLA